MPKPKPLIPLKRLTVHLPSPIVEAIKKEAKAQGLSVSKLVGFVWVERGMM